MVSNSTTTSGPAMQRDAGRLTLAIVIVRQARDQVTVRRLSRRVAELLRFTAQEGIRIATAVSEILRIARMHAVRTRVTFLIATETETVPMLEVHIDHEGEGRNGLSRLAASTESDIDAGFTSARRLMDSCRADERADAIVLGRQLPAATRLDTATLAAVRAELAQIDIGDGIAEVEQQNRELLETLAELRQRQEELTALTRELEDTNRGVVALYAEIEEKADKLRRSDEMKSRFLSNTSHELRTPLSSIRVLAQLLLDRIDGDLTAEQEKQVEYIKHATTGLSELVNDLLDLAKIESGKVEVYCDQIEIAALFGTLRGMLRPLTSSDAVTLVFEQEDAAVTLCSDEGKLSQILRNLVANALKFTEAGEVRVTAAIDTPSGMIRFDVSDTGIGIATEHLPLIFEEFEQVANRLQQRGKGTGLGLPLCRKLATLLGGRIDVVSTPDKGSTFSLLLPLSGAACTVQGSAAASQDGAIT